MALTLVLLCPQLLHWKHRNVSGQGHRGQIAEGIWHPFEAWFWRYVLWAHLLFCGGWGGARALLSRVFTSQGLFTTIQYLWVTPPGICRRVFPWKNIGSRFEVIATGSSPCVFSHVGEGCSSRIGRRRAVRHSNWRLWLYWFSEKGMDFCPINFYWKLCIFYNRSLEYWYFDNCKEKKKEGVGETSLVYVIWVDCFTDASQ